MDAKDWELIIMDALAHELVKGELIDRHEVAAIIEALSTMMARSVHVLTARAEAAAHYSERN